MNQLARPSYSFTIVNVGLETRHVSPMPRAIPRTKAVLPLPSSPYMATTLPSGRGARKIRAGLFGLRFTVGQIFLHGIPPILKKYYSTVSPVA